MKKQDVQSHGPGGDMARRGHPRGEDPRHDAAPARTGGVLKPSEAQAPRKVIRGANREVLNIGWLRGSFAVKDMDGLINALRAFFGDPEHDDRGAYFRHHKYFWEGSIILAYDLPDDKNASPSAVLDIPATPIEGLSPDERLNLLCVLSAVGFKATRVDASWDDMTKRIKPEQVFFIVQKGHATHLQTLDFHCSGNVKKELATTLGLGKRGKDGSGRYVRIYRKDLESKGAINAVRWEVEFSDDHAHAAFEKLANCMTQEQLAKVLGQLVGGSCDFRDKDDPKFTHGGGHLADAPRYAWWQSIIDELGECRIAPERHESTIASAMEAFRAQWGKTLANIREFKREVKEKDFLSWLLNLIEEGKAQLTKRHKRKRDIEHKYRQQIAEISNAFHQQEEHKRAADEITYYSPVSMISKSIELYLGGSTDDGGASGAGHPAFV